MVRKRKAEQSPCFFKVLVGDQYKEKLKIPHGFVKHFNGKAPHELVLRVYNRRFWHVEVKEVDGAFFLQNGWNGFLTDNLLRPGDFLVFKFSGDSVFDVIILDKTGCEKVLPTDVKAEPPEPETDHKRNRVSVEHNDVCHCRYIAHSSVKTAGTCKSPQRVEFDRSCCPFKIKRPHFFAKYRPNNLVFPVTFWRESGLLHKAPSAVLLHDPRGSLWEMTVYQWSDARCHLGPKWRTFLAENKHRVGDGCVLELINAADGGCNVEFRVHIFRQEDMSCSCSSCVLERQLL